MTIISAQNQSSIFRIFKYIDQQENIMSLYERLGGSSAITAVVQKFYQIMLQDQRVAHYFATTDMNKQKTRQISFLTLVTGGPNDYEGSDMKTAHCKHSIGHLQFDATWQNLETALHFFNVPSQQIQELKEIFYSVEGQIVNKVEDIESSEKMPYETLGEIAPVTRTIKQVENMCPMNKRTKDQYKESSLMKCPHMRMKQKEFEINSHKISQFEKRKLRQQFINKQEQNKQVKRLSNNPYYKSYY